MPLYKLKCKACNRVFEQVSTIDDSLNIRCDEYCGNTEIMICPTTFIKFEPELVAGGETGETIPR